MLLAEIESHRTVVEGRETDKPTLAALGCGEAVVAANGFECVEKGERCGR